MLLNKMKICGIISILLFQFHAFAQDTNDVPSQGVEENISDNDVIVLDDKSLPWASNKEPEKSDDNILRLKFERNKFYLSENDRIALRLILNKYDGSDFEVKVKSFSSLRKSEAKAREAALRRVLELRKFIEEEGHKFNKAIVKIYGSDNNDSNIDYIDIDKL